MSIQVKQKPLIDFDNSKKVLIKENVVPYSICDSIVNDYGPFVAPAINKYTGTFYSEMYSTTLGMDHVVHSLLQPAWDEVIEFFKFDVDMVEPYELKQYKMGNFFTKHTDNYFNLTEEIDRKITISVQLTDDTEYVGGDLVVNTQRASKKKGSIVAFPSYMMHQVTPIASGTRWSLVTWAWGPYWK